MKLIWCNGFPEIYAQLEGINLTEVYMHVTICKTALVKWCCIDLLSIGGVGMGSICHAYMCILLYMKRMWCNGFLEIWCSGFLDIYAPLEEGMG